MPRFVRQINVRVNGVLNSGEIVMSGPRKGTKGRWECKCSISFILDEPTKIYGADAFEAVSLGLFFLGRLIHVSEKDGWVLWWHEERDHCGFILQSLIDESESGAKA